jgi:hypothetical protein
MTDGASIDDRLAASSGGLDGAEPSAGDELLSRLRVIEEQPLAARADAYAALHEQLSARLESGPHA